MRDWQAANPEKVRAYKRKNEKARHERYYQENRGAILEKVKERSERKSASVLIRRRVWAGEVNPGCIPPWLTDEHLDAMQWFYDEARRLTKETGISHIVDHIHPLNGAHSCGLHVPWNLQVLTDAENKRKRFREDSNF
jgi:5-methylcytosine-specific restriction endonuclease McrA